MEPTITATDLLVAGLMPGTEYERKQRRFEAFNKYMKQELTDLENHPVNIRLNALLADRPERSERARNTTDPTTESAQIPVTADNIHNIKEAKERFSSRFLDEFTVKRVLGKGAYGCVFEAVNNLDQGVFAVKRVAVNVRMREHFLREVRAMAKLDHSHIIGYKGTWIEKPPEGWQYDEDMELLKMLGSPSKQLMQFNDDCEFLYIQMQLCNYSLKEWLRENRSDSTRNLPRMKSWFKQIVEAVHYIHEKNLIHRDLKPSNILFAEIDHLKVCDLGIATERRIDEQTDTTITRTIIGSMLYLSPEQFFNMHSSRYPYGSKTDVFTLGLILSELCVAITNRERSEIFDNFRHGIQCDRIQDSGTAKFIKKLTQVEPKDRPSCREMLDDLFLA